YDFLVLFLFFFFFQAEDGIRDFHVTGVQTCALPISGSRGVVQADSAHAEETNCRAGAPLDDRPPTKTDHARVDKWGSPKTDLPRSEERRVGKECRSGGSGED